MVLSVKGGVFGGRFVEWHNTIAELEFRFVEPKI